MKAILSMKTKPPTNYSLRERLYSAEIVIDGSMAHYNGDLTHIALGIIKVLD